jgi:hypothetical protein
MFGLFLLSAYLSTDDLVTLKFQANEHPPLATSPHPVGPSARFANSSTGQKPCTKKMKNFEEKLFQCHFLYDKSHSDEDGVELRPVTQHLSLSFTLLYQTQLIN